MLTFSALFYPTSRGKDEKGGEKFHPCWLPAGRSRSSRTLKLSKVWGVWPTAKGFDFQAAGREGVFISVYKMNLFPAEIDATEAHVRKS